ncbi:alpha/beta hydrolase fold domain-containing protein [Streptomyces sp. BBFR102]|uniref:alpha/beta hydrolase fold domain-containing protein n=1 Tax=Streptomyces sp. BBFR102 TaxID=3448171 RepID=UPI003F52B14D
MPATPAEPPPPAPPYDPELAAAAAELRRTTPDTAEVDMVPALREAVAAYPEVTDDQLTAGGAWRVEEDDADGVPVLVCRPTAPAPGPLPFLCALHGGGMIVGDRRAGVLDPLTYARELGCAVVSVDYRLAPEYPHPAPVEDCLTALSWTLGEGAAAHGLDPDRSVLHGTSAGGGLAAGAALLARDRGVRLPAALMLLSPMLDDRNDSLSARQLAGCGVWDRAANEAGWAALLGRAAGGPGVPPYAAPARARDLSGLPPLYLDVGSAETFRDEGAAFASRVWGAGGRAELHVWPGAFHGSDGLVPGARISRAARAARLDWLRRVLELSG